ncbi:MAG: sigma 54-interacting transcriptional regulator [Bryobacterales bacterium]|nr:sigma 54-interacting transcriptional regulator [Bryobacterales bacterium]
MPDRPQDEGSRDPAADTAPAAPHSVILDSLTEGVFTVGHDWTITCFNRAAERITGIPKERALDKPCKDIFRANICESECTLRQTIETGVPIIGKRITILDAQGNRKPVSISTAILRDESGRVVGGVETFRDLTAIEHLRKQLRRDFRFEDIISSSPRMHELFTLLPDVSDSQSTVLIEGETGTGKELVARAIHNQSRRCQRPFVAVNCGALPDTLLESELFGYKAGAFTDARKDKLGRFALADGGTLFLDEIGDVSPALQVRLLRVLQERVYEPLGSVHPVKADVRIITATNKTLSQLVSKGQFREDLYYRINVVRLEIPPLRERMEDIPLLVEHFIDRLNSLQGREVAGISDDALACLMAHAFPGNIRELENIIERAFVVCHSGWIQPAHLPVNLCAALHPDSTASPSMNSFEQVEASFLLSALRRNKWSRLETARQLGIHKTTLFRKMKSLGIQAPGAKPARSQAVDGHARRTRAR